MSRRTKKHKNAVHAANIRYDRLDKKYTAALMEIRRLSYEYGFALRDLEAYKTTGKPYEPTQSTCEHERLTEEGQCRRCGDDEKRKPIGGPYVPQQHADA